MPYHQPPPFIGGRDRGSRWKRRRAIGPAPSPAAGDGRHRRARASAAPARTACAPRRPVPGPGARGRAGTAFSAPTDRACGCWPVPPRPRQIVVQQVHEAELGLSDGIVLVHPRLFDEFGADASEPIAVLRVGRPHGAVDNRDQRGETDRPPLVVQRLPQRRLGRRSPRCSTRRPCSARDDPPISAATSAALGTWIGVLPQIPERVGLHQRALVGVTRDRQQPRQGLGFCLARGREGGRRGR